ncbi:MAG: calcium/sodium antiporter [Gammaproteobacteria bacterium]|nr:calcium/sodium antiporter [Gammaproteobacteria bacterium]
MLIDIIAILAGFGLLIWSSDFFVTGASATARNLGVSPLIIGLTIVGFGTSAPEIMVAVFAASGGNPGLAVGNAIGSNITNIVLVLGVTALIVPLSVHSSLLKREYPLLLLATILACLLLAMDNHLGRIDGLIMSVALLGTLYWLVKQAMASRNTDPIIEEFEHEIPHHMPMHKALMLLVAGLLILLASSKLLVWGAVNVAHSLGISDLIIGLTIVAIGTSLPELGASIASVRKNEPDIAMGNIIGSNVFNTLGVLGTTGLIQPSIMDPGVLNRDLPLMFILTIVLFIMAFGFRNKHTITRLKGGMLFVVFIGYEALLYFSATA